MIKFKNFFDSKFNKNKKFRHLKNIILEKNKEIELLHQILDETPCHIYWKNIDNKYLGCNSSQANELGLKHKKDIINKSVYDLINNKDHSKAVEYNDKMVMETGNLSTFDEHVKKKYFLSIKKPLINKHNKIVGMIGISIDNTTQKVLEKKLSKALDQAKVDQSAKSVFITNLSHDIRTPITSMLGLIDSLKSKLNSDETLEITHTLEKLTKNFLNFFNDILHTIEMPGKVKSSQIFFNAKQMLNDVVDLFSESAKQKGVELIVETSEDFPLLIKSYDLIMKSIIANLIGNAIKFTNRGHVKITLCFQKNRNTLLLSVEDTGIGIPKEKLSKIFDRFTRLHQNHVSHNTSSGLGLFMVRKHVKSMMGKINVKSTVGEGSTFVITIPISETRSKSIASETTPLPHGTFPKINLPTDPRTLIIEDTKLAAIALKDLLSKKDFDSTIVENGYDALNILKKQTFDVIFLDLGLPDIDGINLLPQIKAVNPTLKTYIIVLSGHINPEIHDTCIKNGADAVFTKPFSIEYLNELFIV